MSNFWLSWWHTSNLGPFELHSPWWISGERGSDDAQSICAAVIAENEYAAKNIVDRAYDSPPGQLEWRFCETRPENWIPFSGRFPKADWMKWPEHAP